MVEWEKILKSYRYSVMITQSTNLYYLLQLSLFLPLPVSEFVILLPDLVF